LNVLGWPLFAPVPGDVSSLLPLVRDLSEIGVLLLMFVAGLETDLAEMRRVGKVAFWSAFGGVALPMAAGAAIAVVFGFPLFWQGLFIGTILTATSVSISAQTLLELGAFRSKEGATILGAAVIDDVMGIIVLSLVVAFAKASAGGVHWVDVAVVAGRIVVFFVLAILAGRGLRPLLSWASTLGVSQAVLGAALVVAFAYGWAAEYVGEVAAITGSYVAGVLVAKAGFKEQVDAGIHPLTYSMFVPVFFIGIGLQANGRELGAHVWFTVAVVAAAIVTKVVGCGAFAWLFGFTRKEATRVGIGMISRGEVGLIVAGYGLTNRLIAQDVFSASVLMVLITTMVTPPLLRLVFPAQTPEEAIVEPTIGHRPVS
jgi:Kef-type K+ transport system membrane component KefB